jgi:hypothetical protein
MKGHEYVDYLKRKGANLLPDVTTNPVLSFTPSTPSGSELSSSDIAGINALWNEIKTRKPEIERAIDARVSDPAQNTEAKRLLGEICTKTPEQMIDRDHRATANGVVDDWLNMDQGTVRKAGMAATGLWLAQQAVTTGKVNWTVSLVVMACVYFGGIDAIKSNLIDPAIEYGRGKWNGASNAPMVAEVDSSQKAFDANHILTDGVTPSKVYAPGHSSDVGKSANV